MLQFDGVLGNRTDPLMQGLVELDKQVLSRLFVNTNDDASDQVKILRDKYVPIRLTLFGFVESLNDQALF